jgi:Domain of unknown function (DUF5664)
MNDPNLSDILNRIDEEMLHEPPPSPVMKKNRIPIPQIHAEPEPQIEEGGIKNDHGKLPWHLLPSDAIDDVLEVLQYGAAKYGARNWELGMAWSRPFSALMRHMWAWWRGEIYDPESGKPHLAHAACCVLFLVAYERRGVGVDDRVKR